MEKFIIDEAKLCWIDGSADNADDICPQGNAVVYIGNERFNYNATVVGLLFG